MSASPALRRSTVRPQAAAAPHAGKVDVLRGALFVVIALAVSRAHEVLPFASVLRPGLLCIAISVVACFMNPALMARDWVKRWPVNLLLGILVAVLFSIVFGISQGSSAVRFADTFSKVLITIFLIIAALRSVRDMWLFVWAYVAGAAVLAGLSLLVFGTVAEGSGIARLDANITWDANDIGLMSLIGLALSFLTFRTSGKLGKLMSLPIALALAATIVKTGSRGAFLGLATVMLAFLISMKGTSVIKRLAFVVALGVGGVIAAPEGYFAQMNTVVNAKEDYNWDAPQGRRQVWLRGLGYIASYPVFGLGFGNFGRAEGQLSDLAKSAALDGRGVKWSAAHNTYLEAIAEIGIPGGLAVCAVILGAITIPWKLRRRIPPQWATGTWEQQFMMQAAVFLPLATLGFAVTGIFLSFAFAEPAYYLGALAGALLIFVEQELRRGSGAVPKAPPSRRPRYGAMIRPTAAAPVTGLPTRVYVTTPSPVPPQSRPGSLPK